MLSYSFVIQFIIVGETAYLKTISSCKENRVPPFLQFSHNRDEERHMRRIIQIYPNLPIFSRAVQLGFIQNVAISNGSSTGRYFRKIKGQNEIITYLRIIFRYLFVRPFVSIDFHESPILEPV